MGFIKWARRLVGRPARPEAPKPEPRVMHYLGPGNRARCGADWTPAAPLTVELKMVDCERCTWLAQRDRITTRATRR